MKAGPAPVWLVALDNVLHTLNLDWTPWGTRICERVDGYGYKSDAGEES